MQRSMTGTRPQADECGGRLWDLYAWESLAIFAYMQHIERVYYSAAYHACIVRYLYGNDFQALRNSHECSVIRSARFFL